MSALKKAERGDYLIVRIYNISSKKQESILKFYDGFIIKGVEVVNLLEEKPENIINAEIDSYDMNKLNITLHPHVIVTLKIDFEFVG